MKRFRVNEPNVVYEAFDEEIVLVNLETGNYFSIRGTGPEIWLALARGESAGQIGGSLPARYSGDPQAMEAAVAEFAETLVEAGLLVVVDEEGAWAAAAIDGTGAGIPFAPPVLESYADMQDLLMLDPIHDVDAAGWPAANQI